MVIVKVKWGKESYDVDVDLSLPVSAFKLELQRLTSVPADKQKIMGVKQGTLKDDADVNQAGLTPGKVLMLIGSAEAIAPPPAQPVLFAEDGGFAGGHAAGQPTSNGLVNVGNTCYLNSALQLLRAVPELRDVALASTQDIPRLLYQLLRTLDETKDAISPVAFWLKFIQLNPAFGQADDHGHMMQHDSQEALSAILQTFSTTIDGNAALSKYSALFRGQMHSKVSCVDDPNYTKEELLPFGVLPCNIAGDVQTLEAGLEQAMDEAYKGRNDAMGGVDTTFNRKNRLHQLPEYLIVHFGRFTWRNDTKTKAKILKPITFPFVLDVLTLCSDELKVKLAPERELVRARRDKAIEERKRQRQKSGQDVDPTQEAKKDESTPADPAAQPAETPVVEESIPLSFHNESGFYELCAVISHKGREADHGHYVSWVKKGAFWMIYDDHHTACVTEEDIRRLRGIADAHIAYVLLYRSRDPDTKMGPLMI